MVNFAQNLFNIMKKSILLIALLFSMTLLAQRSRRDGNRIGISGGVTQTSLMTSNFNTKAVTGWAGGFSVRGNYYNDFSMVLECSSSKTNFQ